MDLLEPGLIAAVAGALAGFFGALFQSYLQRKQNSKSLAAAFLGEVSAILKLADTLKPAISMAEYVARLKNNEGTTSICDKGC